LNFELSSGNKELRVRQRPRRSLGTLNLGLWTLDGKAHGQQKLPTVATKTLSWNFELNEDGFSV
jgi:hypothetical protein